jgi:hypothetical protein
MAHGLLSLALGTKGALDRRPRRRHAVTKAVEKPLETYTDIIEPLAGSLKERRLAIQRSIFIGSLATIIETLAKGLS